MSTPVPFVDLAASYEELRAELDAALLRVGRSGRYLLGPELERFEAEFAAYCGVEHCVGVGSGMSAIELALRAAGIGPGDEVIVPSYTWVATWLAVRGAGARPVGIDVEGGTFNLDPRLLSAALSERTAAIVPVHLRGEPADMTAIADFAARHGLLVLEDAAQAHGARWEGARVGGLGRAGAFSFYPSKNLGALGDGGAVTTDDGELADRVRALRNYGMKSRYEVEGFGVNSRLAEIQAAVLRVKLARLDGWNRARAALAERYRDALGGVEAVALPRSSPASEPVWHLFVVNYAARDALAQALRRGGVETHVHYPLLPHLTPPFRELGFGPGSFPVAERLAATALSLPMYPQLEPAAPERVASLIAEAS